VSDLDEALRRERTVASGLWTDLGHQTFYYGQSGSSFHGEQSYGRPAMDEVQASALRRLVEAAKASGATPVLVIEPGRYPDSVESTTITEYIAWLSDFATELDVELWDTYSMDWDAAMFADDAHLNEIGTESYTEYIGRLLIELADPTRAVSAQSASTSPAAKIASARAAASPGRTEMVSTPPPP
jgi:hypothetical protein